MNKKERKKLAEDVRRAARMVEKEHDYSCNALDTILWRRREYYDVMQLYKRMFKPRSRYFDDAWFGEIVKRVQVNQYSDVEYVNNKEAQDHRVVALCLLADIIEEEGV